MERPDPSAPVSDWVIPALVIGGLAIAGALVWALSSGVASQLRRSVGDLADSAEAVTRGHLDTRVQETDDELGRLGQSFNRMTARLEAADVRQREFLADVAHELRPPSPPSRASRPRWGTGPPRRPRSGPRRPTSSASRRRACACSSASCRR